MRNIGDFKDPRVPLGSGALDGRAPASEDNPLNHPVLLNVNPSIQRGLPRLPGFTAWASGDPSNEDLHDQLLGGSGHIVDDVFENYSGDTEAITLLAEAVASTGVNYSIAGTKTRLYVSTGRGRNWRIIADNLAGGFVEGESKWTNTKMRCAQVGDFMLFTNDIDNVLAWPIGGPVISEGPNADRRWAAFEVFDLLGLGITRAGVVASWDGFAFLGDVVMEGTRFPGRLIWSDAGAPLEWAPGGESLAGYVDLGGGETILRIETIGGQLRVYTDEAIYAVTLVGGDAVFQATEIYRGPMALAFQESLVNMGDIHLWMTQDSIVTLGAYDRVPNRQEWIHRAAGFIFKGMDGAITNDYPGNFDGFNPINKALCYQIASGHDENLENVWLSWPTTRASDETPDDANDFDGVRRLTLVMNYRYQKATLVDHGFSAFANMRYHSWGSIRDFMIEHGVCSPDELLADEVLVGEKEGAPLNTVDELHDHPPVSIWNDTEDPTLPMGDNSLAAQTCDEILAIDCKECVSEPFFAMASTLDLCIKKFDISSGIRQIYLPDSSSDFVPHDDPSFPNVQNAVYREDGYPTLIQGAMSQWGSRSEKICTRVVINYDAEAQATPGTLFCQIGVTNSPKCVHWHDADPITLDCLQSGLEDDERSIEPAMFEYHRVGSWVGYRVFVASEEDGEFNYAPVGCQVTFNDLAIRAKIKNETFANQ